MVNRGGNLGVMGAGHLQEAEKTGWEVGYPRGWEPGKIGKSLQKEKHTEATTTMEVTGGGTRSAW